MDPQWVTLSIKKVGRGRLGPPQWGLLNLFKSRMPLRRAVSSNFAKAATIGLE